MNILNRIHLIALGASLLLIQLSCSTTTDKKVDKSTLQEKAKVSINNWVRKHPEEYKKYKPISFEDFTVRYEKTELTHYLSDKIEEEQAKPTVNKHVLDSLKNLLENNKGLLMGYTIIHKYHTKSVTGEVINHKDLVFLDTIFRIATILEPDAYDMILDQKIIFRPDSLEKK
ncbi:MAG: hypothetical protein HXX16_04175 [Bacteroidales bacterium]|nr:hypothetical protein [Bacteroidales bacterium]